jgi:phage tail-like protein
MPQVPVARAHFDPYKPFRFRLRWDGRVVAGASTVSSLTRTTEVVAYREDSDLKEVLIAGSGAGFEAITLERGPTVDAEFDAWANAGQPIRDVDLEICNEAGQLVLAYTVHRAWVSHYQALPDLDADTDAVAIQQIRLENDGWSRRDIGVEPVEPDVSPIGVGQEPPPVEPLPMRWARLSELLRRLLRRRHR